MPLTNVYPSLKGKTVLITGGATGIGANLVASFAHQGAHVAFLDIRDDEGRALADKLTNEVELPPRYYPCDLLDIDALRSTIARIKQDCGPVGVLINNAANDARHDFRDVTVDYWDERMAVNVRHHFFASQAVYAHMCALGGGAIINLGSMSWYASQGGMPGYTSAKAAIEGLTRGLARDMGGEGIRVNTLVPGWVMTERQMETLIDARAVKGIRASQCLKTSVMPEDISAMALFLASDDSRLCTAQHFIVDGGWV